MKKYLLAVVLAFAVVGCGDPSNGDDNQPVADAAYDAEAADANLVGPGLSQTQQALNNPAPSHIELRSPSPAGWSPGNPSLWYAEWQGTIPTTYYPEPGTSETQIRVLPAGQTCAVNGEPAVTGVWCSHGYVGCPTQRRPQSIYSWRQNWGSPINYGWPAQTSMVSPYQNTVNASSLYTYQWGSSWVVACRYRWPLGSQKVTLNHRP